MSRVFEEIQIYPITTVVRNTTFYAVLSISGPTNLILLIFFLPRRFITITHSPVIIADAYKATGRMQDRPADSFYLALMCI